MGVEAGGMGVEAGGMADARSRVRCALNLPNGSLCVTLKVRRKALQQITVGTCPHLGVLVRVLQ